MTERPNETSDATPRGCRHRPVAVVRRWPGRAAQGIDAGRRPPWRRGWLDPPHDNSARRRGGDVALVGTATGAAAAVVGKARDRADTGAKHRAAAERRARPERHAD